MARDGLRLHYLDWGIEGNPPMICLHGLTGHAGTWNAFARGMRDRYHVIALDQRGHGESEWAHDGYDPRDYVADLAALCEHLGKGRITVIGLSLGGMVAIQFAALFPESVERIVVVDIGPAPSSGVIERRREEGAYPSRFESLDAAVEWAQRGDAWPRPQVLREDLGGRLRLQGDGSWVWKTDPQAMATSSLGFWAQRAESHWAAYAGIHCPVLAVRGLDSDYLSDEIRLRMQRLNERCRWIDIPAAGHNVVSDQPAPFLKAVRNFLEAAP